MDYTKNTQIEQSLQNKYNELLQKKQLYEKYLQIYKQNVETKQRELQSLQQEKDQFNLKIQQTVAHINGIIDQINAMNAVFKFPQIPPYTFQI